MPDAGASVFPSQSSAPRHRRDDAGREPSVRNVMAVGRTSTSSTRRRTRTTRRWRSSTSTASG
jgi:hypothetical protein